MSIIKGIVNYKGQRLITGPWFLLNYPLPTHSAYCFPIWFSFLLSIIEPIFLLNLKYKDRKVCCRTRLNDGISLINSLNWNRMKNWLKLMRRSLYKCPTFLKTKQFQFQRSYSCLALAINLFIAFCSLVPSVPYLQLEILMLIFSVYLWHVKSMLHSSKSPSCRRNLLHQQHTLPNEILVIKIFIISPIQHFRTFLS